MESELIGGMKMEKITLTMVDGKSVLVVGRTTTENYTLEQVENTIASLQIELVNVGFMRDSIQARLDYQVSLRAKLQGK